MDLGGWLRSLGLEKYEAVLQDSEIDEVVEAKRHYDQAVELYEPAEHRPLATRFGQDGRVTTLSYRSLARWMLGYPEAALADTARALKDAREMGHAVTLMIALSNAWFPYMCCGDYATANAIIDELATLADERGSLTQKNAAVIAQGALLAVTNEATDAVHTISSGLNAWRSTESAVIVPYSPPYLASAYSEIGQLDDAWRCITEATTAIETTNERWSEAEINRMAGEIALKSPEPDVAKAQGYFERALAVARQQQAKSWELRAAMSMARLWRDQGKRDAARDLLAPVYGWFTEGFDTLDLKEAKALLEQLAT